MKTVLGGLLCLALVGCSGSGALSQNKRMAYADSGATLATAVALDQVSVDKFDDTKAELIAICDQLKKFLDDGLIADLPVDKARQAIVDFMNKKGWTAYISLVDLAFSWVEAQKLPTDKIGANNILVIKEGLTGVQTQAARAKKEWAQPLGSANVDTTKGRSLTIRK